MKNILKAFFSVLGLIAILTACDKKESLPFYEHGTAPVLTSDVTTVTPTANDSTNAVLTLSWTDPHYATDSSNVKYIIQIDSSGGNFSNASNKEVIGATSVSYSADELNAILIGFGVSYGVAFNLDIRLISSYINNNDAFTSNTITVSVTRIPTKVTLPSTGKLYISGSATQGGTIIPVPVPEQEFSKVSESAYGGIFYLVGGGDYVILPKNDGSLDEKYNVADNSIAGLENGGEFGYNLSDNFPAPAASGWYKIGLNFSSGTFTVMPYTETLPTSLFIVGDATQGGWTSPVPTPSQQFTRINSTNFELSLPLNGGFHYLLLPQNTGSFSPKYGCLDNTVDSAKWGGPLLISGKDIPAPDESATYKIAVSFFSNTYALTKQ
ncbi:MAG: SusE domain-containing protein [Parafilimonas sp.]